MKTLLIAGLSILSLAGGARAEAPLRLACEGRAERETLHSSVNHLASGKTSYSTSRGTRQLSTRLLFELTDGAARIHLPMAVLPYVSGGDADGWWPLSDLKVSEDAISGHVRVNILNKPTIRIDRLTGEVEISGWNSIPFRGDCETMASAARKF